MTSCIMNGPSNRSAVNPHHTICLGLVCAFLQHKKMFLVSLMIISNNYYVYLQILQHGTQLRPTIGVYWKDVGIFFPSQHWVPQKILYGSHSLHQTAGPHNLACKVGYRVFYSKFCSLFTWLIHFSLFSIGLLGASFKHSPYNIHIYSMVFR